MNNIQLAHVVYTNTIWRPFSRRPIMYITLLIRPRLEQIGLGLGPGRPPLL